MPSYLQVDGDGVRLAVKVQPRAAKNQIGAAVGNELKIKVAAPPVESAANEALLRLLAEAIGCSRGAVKLVRGQTSRHKQVYVKGFSIAELADKLLHAAAK